MHFSVSFIFEYVASIVFWAFTPLHHPRLQRLLPSCFFFLLGSSSTLVVFFPFSSAVVWLLLCHYFSCCYVVVLFVSCWPLWWVIIYHLIGTFSFKAIASYYLSILYTHGFYLLPLFPFCRRYICETFLWVTGFGHCGGRRLCLRIDGMARTFRWGETRGGWLAPRVGRIQVQEGICKLRMVVIILWLLGLLLLLLSFRIADLSRYDTWI